jgi:hypothetical protein
MFIKTKRFRTLIVTIIFNNNRTMVRDIPLEAPKSNRPPFRQPTIRHQDSIKPTHTITIRLDPSELTAQQRKIHQTRVLYQDIKQPIIQVIFICMIICTIKHL